MLHLFWLSSVNFIFSNWLLMYLSDEELKAVMEKMLNWLQPGGFLFFRESCNHRSGTQLSIPIDCVLHFCFVTIFIKSNSFPLSLKVTAREILTPPCTEARLSTPTWFHHWRWRPHREDKSLVLTLC